MDSVQAKIEMLEKEIEELKNIQGNELLLKSFRSSMMSGYRLQLHYEHGGRETYLKYKDKNDKVMKEGNEALRAFDEKYPIPNFDYNNPYMYFGNK